MKWQLSAHRGWLIIFTMNPSVSAGDTQMPESVCVFSFASLESVCPVGLHVQNCCQYIVDARDRTHSIIAC